MRTVPFGLTGQQLKWIALVCMTVDHIGHVFFPGQIWLRVIGRMAFPIFAYMIAEGFRYTRSRLRYGLTICTAAVMCQIIYAVALQSACLCVFVTFSLSIGLIALADRANVTRKAVWWVALVAAMAALWVVTTYGPRWWYEVSFDLDYGFCGILTPLLVYYGRTREEKWCCLAVALVFVALAFGGVQWYGLLALLPMALYNGERGRRLWKPVFYVYYPLHLAVIYGLDRWVF